MKALFGFFNANERWGQGKEEPQADRETWAFHPTYGPTAEAPTGHLLEEGSRQMPRCSRTATEGWLPRSDCSYPQCSLRSECPKPMKKAAAPFGDCGLC